MPRSIWCGWVPAACQPKGAFVDERCYPKVSDVPKWLDVSPRFGLAYDIFGNGREQMRQQADTEKDELYKQIGQLKVELDFLKKRAGLIA